MFYTLRYRQGLPGVRTDLIEASNDDAALKVGQWFCNQHIGRKFIGVSRAVVATEADLPNNRSIQQDSDLVRGAAGEEPQSPTVQGQRMIAEKQAKAGVR